MSTPPRAPARTSMRLRPDPDLVSSARLFAAAIAREAGADERSIDDLKLAVTEACAGAIGAGAGAIDLELVADAARLSVRVAAAGIGDASAAHDAPVGHLALVSALFDDTDIGSDAVSFSVPLA